MTQEAGISARVQVCGTLEFKDAQGNVVKTIEFKGAAPLTQEQENEDGMDDCERGQEGRA